MFFNDWHFFFLQENKILSLQNAKDVFINLSFVDRYVIVTTPKKKDFNFVCKGSKHLFSALQLLYTRASFSREATAMGQRFLYQSDLIFQSIKSVITTRANTAIALQSACDRAAFGVFFCFDKTEKSSSRGK